MDLLDSALDLQLIRPGETSFASITFYLRLARSRINQSATLSGLKTSSSAGRLRPIIEEQDDYLDDSEVWPL